MGEAKSQEISSFLEFRGIYFRYFFKSFGIPQSFFQAYGGCFMICFSKALFFRFYGVSLVVNLSNWDICIPTTLHNTILYACDPGMSYNNVMKETERGCTVTITPVEVTSLCHRWMSYDRFLIWQKLLRIICRILFHYRLVDICPGRDFGVEVSTSTKMSLKIFS